MKSSRSPSARALVRVCFRAGLAGLVVIALDAGAQGTTFACGPLNAASADYLVEKHQVAQSEQYHFTPEVEALIRGKSTATIGSDIHWMLDLYPNHHRALVAMMRLGEKQKTPMPGGAKYTVDCYFERAVRFRPDDMISRMLYASFLAKNGRRADAAAQLDVVNKNASDNPFTHYNLGLIYLEMQEYDKALTQAHKAKELGFGRAELRDKLKAAGKWRDPDAPVRVSASTNDSAPASARAASGAK